MLKLLIVGNGGREDALASYLEKDPRVSKIYCAPGNGGSIRDKSLKLDRVDISPTDIFGLRRFAMENRVDFTIVGPESSLEKGIVDAFLMQNLRIFGPSMESAKLETSKIYAKELMEFLRIPTAKFMTFSNPKEAYRFIHFTPMPKRGWVIKADGLAAGKGVFLCTTKEEACNAIDNMSERFGEAGHSFLIEEVLIGEEISFFVMTDGLQSLPIGYCKDYKKLENGNVGPNTGGMGAVCSPLVDLSPRKTDEIMKTIVVPLISYMREQGKEYRGILYVGLMMVKGKPHVLEFNARFGDPETQVILRRLRGDLLSAMLSVADRTRYSLQRSFYMSDETALCVNIVSDGYPEKTGYPSYPISAIGFAESVPTVEVYHAGTQRLSDNTLVSNGGRVLSVTGTDLSIGGVRHKVYTAVRRIKFENGYYRTDIGE